MQTFEVLVEETLSGSFLVEEAASADEAVEAARRAYRTGELVL